MISLNELEADRTFARHRRICSLRQFASVPLPKRWFMSKNLQAPSRAVARLDLAISDR